MSNQGPSGSDHQKSSRDSRRVGDIDRHEAIERLQAHWEAGRLDPGEHELRVTKAKAAVTRADLDSLFTDLPSSAGVSDSSLARSDESSPAPFNRSRGLVRSGGFLDHGRDTIMALMPFAATILFFTTGQWLWFLMIPISGIVLYGADDDKARDRKRKRNRG